MKITAYLKIPDYGISIAYILIIHCHPGGEWVEGG